VSATNGGPAFPALRRLSSPSHDYIAESIDGMSLRDYFAAKALPSAYEWAAAQNEIDHWQLAASEAYSMADAMIAERSKP
jgi:hypothetical protein